MNRFTLKPAVDREDTDEQPSSPASASPTVLDQMAASATQALSDSVQCSCDHKPEDVHKAGHMVDRDQSDKDGGASQGDDMKMVKCRVHGTVVVLWISSCHIEQKAWWHHNGS